MQLLIQFHCNCIHILNSCENKEFHNNNRAKQLYGMSMSTGYFPVNKVCLGVDLSVACGGVDTIEHSHT